MAHLGATRNYATSLQGQQQLESTDMQAHNPFRTLFVMSIA